MRITTHTRQTPRGGSGLWFRSAFVGAVLAAAALTQARADLADGLVAYYPLDGNPRDAVGKAHGTSGDGSTLTYAAGKFGQAVDLDGATQFIETPESEEDLFDFGAPDEPTGFSVSAWFRVDDFTKSWQCLVAKGEGNRWRIHRRGGESIMTGNGGNADVPAGPTDVRDDKIHHLVLVSVPKEEKVLLYIDGKLESEGPAPNLENNARPMMIGENPDARNRTWDGLIDDLAFWKRPITEAEVKQIFSSASSLGDLIKPPGFNLDFNSNPPAGTLELIQTGGGEPPAIIKTGGVNNSGYLRLTDAENGARAAIIFKDTTGGKPISAFKFKVDCRIGGGTERPADGFSINIVRPGDPLLTDAGNPRGEGYAASPGGEANLPEEGSTTGLGIGFDTWDSGAGDKVGFSVRVDNELIEQIEAPTLNGAPTDVTSLQTGPRNEDNPDKPYEKLTWQPFEVELKTDQTLVINWKGKNIYNKKINFFPSPGQIVFGARTGGANEAHHFDNLSLTVTTAELAVLSSVVPTREQVVFTLQNSDKSKVDPKTITLKVDGQTVTPTVATAGNLVTVTHKPAAPWAHGSTHAFELAGKDNNGNTISAKSDFKLPTPVFPAEDLVGPKPSKNGWGTRFIFETGESVTGIQKVIGMIQSAGKAGFSGIVHDSVQKVVNFGDNGLFADSEGYPQGAQDKGCCGEDFINVNIGHIKIAEAGQYTFGVHSDDGFGLRIRGAKFISVNGGGNLDKADPEAVLHPADTGDSNTRAVAELGVGVYRIEFFWWERGGGDHGEIYAAKGAFKTDADTDTWKLIGDTSGGTQVVKLGLDSAGVTWTSSKPGGAQLTTIEQGLDDLKNSPGKSGVFNIMSIGDPQSGHGEIFPENTPADDDDYALLGKAKMVVPQDGTYVLGFNSDDGGYLKVAGQKWGKIISSEGDKATVDGDKLIFPDPTGNSNTYAEITLKKGTYDIEAMMYERGGGSYIDVKGALKGAGGLLPILAKDGAGIFTIGGGLPLTDEAVGTGGGGTQTGGDRPLVTAAQISSGKLNLGFSGGTGPFLLQASVDLKTWVDIESKADRNFSLPSGGGAIFFRVGDKATKTVKRYSAVLSGAAEVPAVATSAVGTAVLSIEGDKLSYVVAYAGLKQAATAGHIHGPAAATATAGVLVPFTAVGTMGTSGAFAGTATLTAAQKTAIEGGQAYVNVHSGANPGGEIRGQISAQ